MPNFLLCAAIISSIFSILALLLAITALIKVISAEKSTHQMEYMPLDPKWSSSDKEIEEFNQNEQAQFPDLDDNEITDPAELNLRNLI